MEFKHIEYFIETCSHKSISQAAEALFISQQALSRCIGHMEAELGCKLLTRSSRGICLTEEGQYFYDRFSPIVQSYRSTLREALSHLEHGPQKVSFACAPLIFGILDTELLFSFQEEHPEIMLEGLEMTDREIDGYVAEDAHHFGLLAIPENRHGQRFDYIPLKTMPLRLYVHKDNPLAAQKQVEFSMLSGENFLAMEKRSHYHSILADQSRRCGFTPNITYESADITELYKLVDRGKGVFLGIDSPTVASRYPNIRVVPFADDTLTYCIAFVFQDYNKVSAASRQFMEYILAHRDIKV